MIMAKVVLLVTAMSMMPILRKHQYQTSIGVNMLQMLYIIILMILVHQPKLYDGYLMKVLHPVKLLMKSKRTKTFFLKIQTVLNSRGLMTFKI